MSARLILRVGWMSTTNNSRFSNDQIRREITIRGSHVEHISIPYLYKSPWQPCERKDSVGFDFVPFIGISMMNAVASVGDADPVVQLQTFFHAGKDFEFDSLRCAGAVPDDSIVDCHMFPSDFREDPAFGANFSTSFSKRSFEFVESIGQRYDVSYFYTAITPRPIVQNGLDLRGFSNMDSIAQLFWWYRGSVDYLIQIDEVNDSTEVTIHYPRDGDPTLTRVIPGSSAIADGVVKIDPRYTSVLEFRAPLVLKYDWIPSYDAFDPYAFMGDEPKVPVLDIFGNSAVFSPILRKLAPDACFMMHVPPPYKTNWVSSPRPGPLLEKSKISDTQVGVKTTTSFSSGRKDTVASSSLKSKAVHSRRL